MASLPATCRIRLARLAALSAFLFAASAHAVPEDANKVQLEYVRGPGAELCGDEAVVRQAILHQMDHNAVAPSQKSR
jgi:hypothetical protein